MRLRLLASTLLGTALLQGCSPEPESTAAAPPQAPAESEFVVEADRFADIRVLRYRIPGWEGVSLQQKKLAVLPDGAGMSGRDIMWDQNYRHNLRIRRTLEEIVRHYPGDRTTADWNAFMTYAKQVWFANGIHHHYSGDKFMPGFLVRLFPHARASKCRERELAARRGPESRSSCWPARADPVRSRRWMRAKPRRRPASTRCMSSAVNFYAGVTRSRRRRVLRGAQTTPTIRARSAGG